GGDAGIHRMVGVGDQVAAGNVDAERAASLHRARVGGAVDRQGDGVTVVHVAAHDRKSRDEGDRLGGVDRVISREGVESDARGMQGRVDGVALGGGGGGAVECRVEGGDAGIHRVVGIGGQVAAGNVDAERAASLHRAGVGVAVDHQGDGVTVLHVAA